MNHKIRPTSPLLILILGLTFVVGTMLSPFEAEARRKKGGGRKPTASQSRKANAKKNGRANARAGRSGKARQSARSNGATGACGPAIATTTMYFVPHIKDYCPTNKPCAEFKKEVEMQGSGTMYNGQVLRYTGKTETLGSKSCATAEGARGTCLTPFISVAADARYYRMGDIIEMPGLKGREIKMPDGRVLTHPGYLIVEDTGSAIKGQGRFDFFTGAFDDHHDQNAFGYNGFTDPDIVDKKSCQASKKFSRVAQNSSKYPEALASIEEFVTGSSISQNYAKNMPIPTAAPLASRVATGGTTPTPTWAPRGGQQ